MNIGILFVIFYLVFSINGGLKFKFDELTQYKNQDISYMPWWFLLLYLFFGIFFFIFVKKIKIFRKEYYIKYQIKNYERIMNILGVYGMSYDESQKTITPEQYFNYKRYLKLKRIKNKI